MFILRAGYYRCWEACRSSWPLTSMYVLVKSQYNSLEAIDWARSVGRSESRLQSL